MEKQELAELKVSIYNKLHKAISEGDKEKALDLLKEINHNRLARIDIYLTWVDLLRTYIADKLVYCL